MFETFMGLPLHPLVVHAVVVFVPLTVLTAVGFALLPGWRWLLRWPLLVGAVVSFVTAWVAQKAGEYLLASRFGGQVPPELQLHQDRGNLLWWILLGLLAVVIPSIFLLGGPTRLVGGKERASVSSRPLRIGLIVVLVGVAGWAGIQVLLTGDAGARATWG